VDAVRVYFGGPIPFDPATAPTNPTGALRYCSGGAAPLFEAQLFEEVQGEGVEGELVATDGLSVEWPERGTFCNPPYGGELKAWLARFGAESDLGHELVTLLPCSRWEQPYFSKPFAKANALCLIRGRVSFVSTRDGTRPKGAPGASMFLGWNVNRRRFRKAFGPFGQILWLSAP
jgi:hypothetical protein